MTAYVRVLTTSSVDSTPSLLIVSPDGSKILVNCGEGCQRAFMEHSQRLSTVTTICLTHLGHEALGGLPGAILTTADGAANAEASSILLQQQKQQQQQQQSNNGKGQQKQQQQQKVAANKSTETLPGINLVGPQGTQKFMRTLRHFMRRERFPVKVFEGAVENVATTTSSMKPGKTNKSPEKFSCAIKSFAYIDDDQGSEDAAAEHIAGSRKRAHPEDNSNNTANSHLPLRHQVLSYLITTPKIPGKLLTDKARSLGVPKGPLLGRLKKGETVTFTDESGIERTVESSQVVAPSTPAVAILILYYPCRNVAHQMFTESDHLRDAVAGMCLDLVVHIAPIDLFEEFGLPYWTRPKRCDGDEDNNRSVQHVFLTTDRNTGDVDGTPFWAAALGAKTRSLLFDKVYQVPRPPANENIAALDHADYRVGRTMLEYTFLPRSKRGFTNATSLSEERKLTYQKRMEFAKDGGAFEKATKILAECNMEQVSSGAELIFTGTASAIPCKYRNVTGILLKQSDGRSILLDVGEGTIGHLLRMEQMDNTSSQSLLASIRAVWISHPHADHHLGLLRLLKDRKAPEPIQLIAPTSLLCFLDEYCEIDPSIRQAYYYIDCRHFVRDNHELQQRLYHTLGIENCRAVRVAHCRDAYAVILDGTSFGRVVYSGDCRPSRELAQIAKDSDLLIHESTFEDGMEAEAALKRHCTIGEALTVARDMKAKCTILTHFSQRYPRIPPIAASNGYSGPIIYAFDFMRLQKETLETASKLTPALHLLYPDDLVDDDDTDQSSSVAKEAMSVPGAFARNSLL